ncbi:hypothetical protein B0H16DRAFT_1479063 [Mycena metata]|uniref:Uncharacterized protein n=1 Tax=Mycena metata TaxID=1033252 RepID=A0AAD7H5I8_9AGAR|nr:hypothetical protein B0H16DRAFT_1479063 [Mycena metata]
MSVQYFFLGYHAQHISRFIFRIGLEAHCFWMPTEWYQNIVSYPPVPQGKKSFAFVMPLEYVDRLAHELLILIQAAFVRPVWTLVFVDHNVSESSLIQSHTNEQAVQIWPHLWSRTYRPIYHLEPQATLNCLEAWHIETIAVSDHTPIFHAIKRTQIALNGCGAQEVMDALTLTFIQVQMLALYVCADPQTWSRLVTTLIKYDADRVDLSTPKHRLPYVSGPHPLYFNNDGHCKYLNWISTLSTEFAEVPSEIKRKAFLPTTTMLTAPVKPVYVAAVWNQGCHNATTPNLPVRALGQLYQLHNFQSFWCHSAAYGRFHGLDNFAYP